MPVVGRKCNSTLLNSWCLQYGHQPTSKHDEDAAYSWLGSSPFSSILLFLDSDTHCDLLAVTSSQFMRHSLWLACKHKLVTVTSSGTVHRQSMGKSECLLLKYVVNSKCLNTAWPRSFHSTVPLTKQFRHAHGAQKNTSLNGMHPQPPNTTYCFDCGSCFNV